MSSSGDFTYKTVDDKVYITSYTGTETEVIFPAEIDGKSVYGIDPNGRTNCVPNAKVTKVTISEGIQSLESCAFRGATVLTDISLPSTLTSIADHCFIWCYALQEIALPENLKRLGERCFYESTGLKSIKFPESLDALEEGTFINCHSLSKAVFPENVKYNTIPKDFFANCDALTSVNIPEQIETIGDQSFQQCFQLKNITLPNGLKAIGYDAFFCAALEETLTVPKSVQIIGKSAFFRTKISKLCVLCENATIGFSAFSGCEKLAEVELSDGITDIGNSAFYYCKKLSKIKIPRGVTELKNDVFKSCDNLESVEVHDKLTKIGGFTFEGCKKLTSFDFTHITELGDRTFQSCGFKEVKIPGTLTNLGFAVFHWCSELESAELGDGIEEIRAPFAECRALKTVKLPSTLKRIAGVSDFNCCYELKSIDLPEGLEEIAAYAFDRTGLKSITIPDSVTKLGEGIFRECYNLESITLPKELKTVPDGLCKYCSSLKSITIPDSVTTIGNYAFSHTGLERFDGNKDLISIGDYAFWGCASLKQVTMQDSVTSIGEWAFSSAGIEEITLSKNLNRIMEHAFCYCRSLNSVTIPQHVTRLEVAVFADCDSLTDVYAHDKINYIFPGGWQNPAAFADSPNVVIHCPNKYCITARTAINRDLPIVFDSLSRNGETALIDEKNSGFLISNGSLIKLACDYAFKPEEFENCKDPRVIIRVPKGLELIGGYFYLNDKTCTDFKYDSQDNTYSVKVTDPSGKIVIGTTSDDKTYQLKAYAALQAGVNNSTVTETINLFNEYVEPVTISVESSTSTANIKNLVLTDSSGGNVSYTLEFEDEQSPEGEKLAKEYKLKILSDSPSDTYSLSISNAENYSGIKGDISYSIKTINDKLDKVTASVESGKVDKGTKVTLSCSEQNADIYYTLDGSDPTKDGSYALRYTEPITLTDDAEIKAYAVCDGYTDSDVSVFSYSVKKYLIGDVNSDGQVNGADAGVLNRYAAGWKDYNIKIKNFDAADINKDGKVNGADAGILARYTSDWKNYEKYFY
ncbi:MAG: leucine-rich repeat protein [Ruminococcus sp.]|nr:leucine-rich repeat protein [Ruminococcus sp.]